MSEFHLILMLVFFQVLKWFRGLIAEFGPDIKIRVASRRGTPVASILTLSHKKSMIYKYGCSNVVYSQLGGTALLFWRAIQEAKDEGFEEFEMGRSEVDNLGLIRFKEHWGATGTALHYWSYPQESVGLPSVWRQKVARRMVSIFPDIALETVGKLFYKHIG